MTRLGSFLATAGAGCAAAIHIRSDLEGDTDLHSDPDSSRRGGLDPAAEMARCGSVDAEVSNIHKGPIQKLMQQGESQSPSTTSSSPSPTRDPRDYSSPLPYADSPYGSPKGSSYGGLWGSSRPRSRSEDFAKLEVPVTSKKKKSPPQTRRLLPKAHVHKNLGRTSPHKNSNRMSTSPTQLETLMGMNPEKIFIHCFRISDPAESNQLTDRFDQEISDLSIPFQVHHSVSNWFAYDAVFSKIIKVVRDDQQQEAKALVLEFVRDFATRPFGETFKNIESYVKQMDETKYVNRELIIKWMKAGVAKYCDQTLRRNEEKPTEDQLHKMRVLWPYSFNNYQ